MRILQIMLLFLRDSKIEFYRSAPTDTEMRNIVNKKVFIFFLYKI